MRLSLRNSGIAATILIAHGSTLWACPQCQPLVKAGVYNRDFAGNLFVLLLPVAVLLIIGFGLYFADIFKAKLQRGIKS